MKRGEIKAVHDDDLVNFLQSLGEYDKVIAGTMKCQFCGEIITLDNIQSVFPLDGEVAYCCNSTKCYKLLIEGSSRGDGDSTS
ncbi:hypothetical protein HYG86_09070 [Alkalicella caledoniensis]|uniref:Uncharacterized protein n=1 Tax=Alkalicella caledoniensis TaxID=2731377 RepID=A0A7G9W8A0_ALKCA|nr:hypothetical protein [Alkalicella caledoniensis]QNO14912.1 hypothetical protein HYG86_09070 [Alkalicella caledoniensis]